MEIWKIIYIKQNKKYRIKNPIEIGTSTKKATLTPNHIWRILGNERNKKLNVGHLNENTRT